MSDRFARLRALDPLVPLTFLVSLLVYLPHGFDGELTRDLGVYTYGGQQFAEGVAPYVAILNRAGPLAHLIPGIGAWVSRQVGVDDLLGMRVMFMLIAAATVAATYLLVRDVLRSRLGGLVGAAMLLSLHGFLIYATYGPREKTPLVLFTTLALLAVVHRRWATAGCFIALATLTWQPVLFSALVGAGVAALLQPERRFRSLVRIAVGGLVPTAITVGAYAAIGELQTFLNDFLLINAQYTKQVSFSDAPGAISSMMVDLYGWTLWPFLAGLLVQLGLGFVALRSAGRREPRAAAQVGMAAFTLVALLWAFKAFNGWPDCFFMFPVGAVGLGALAVMIAERLSLRVALAATLAWSLAVVGISLHYSIATRDTGLRAQRSDVAAVVRLLPPGARILSVQAPQPLVLSHERNLSVFQLFGNGIDDYVDATYPGGLKGYARWIGEQAPAVIAIGNEGDAPTWLFPTMDGTYTKVGRSPGWSWWVRVDLGNDTVHAIHDALRTGA
ncbi:MAG: ArnT family glycosyltransferase [Nocardioides sp.]